MNTIRDLNKNPRFLVAQIFLEVILTFAILGVGVWVYTQSRTQHEICQAFQFVGDSTQHGITTNSQLIAHDMQLGTKAARADAVIRRQSVAQATDLLIRVRRVKC